MLHLALTKVIAESYSPQPTVIIMKHLFKAKEWLQNSIKEIHGHSEPLCFKFELNSRDEAELCTARWTDGPWKNHGRLLEVNLVLYYLCCY